MKNIPLFALLLVVVFASCNMDTSVYTLSFNANGASGMPPAPITVIQGENGLAWNFIVLPSKGNLAYNEKYFFGWNTSRNGTGRRYSPGNTFRITSNITLYAQWEDEISTAPRNLELSSMEDGMGAFRLTWDAVEGYPYLEDPRDMFLYVDGRIFLTYVVMRRVESPRSIFHRDDFEVRGFTSAPFFNDFGVDLLYGGNYEFFVALGVVTIRLDPFDGLRFDVTLGPHSNIVSQVVYGADDDLQAPDIQVIGYSPRLIQILWSPVPRAWLYRLYYSYDNIQFFRWGRLPDTTSYFFHVDPGTGLYFRVAALNQMFRETFSQSVFVRTPGPPAAPTSISATAHSSTAINVSWNPSIGATAYRIYYEVGASHVRHFAGTVIGTSFMHTGLTPSTDYFYTIRAISLETESVYESLLLSGFAYARTLAPSAIVDPDMQMLILTNNSSWPLRSIHVNGGDNKLSGNLHMNASGQIQLETGTHTITVFDTQDKFSIFEITIDQDNVYHSITDNDFPSFMLALRNNHSIAVARAYLRRRHAGGWGTTILNRPLVINDSLSLGIFEQASYEIMAESLEYYRITSGTNDMGITITGGVIDGFIPVFNVVPMFTLSEDKTAIIPATGWSRIRP